MAAAVDYSRVQSSRSKVSDVADSAVLAAVRAALDYRYENPAGDGWREAAIVASTSYFDKNFVAARGEQISRPTLDVQDAAGNLTVKLDYTASVPSFFLQLIGFKKLEFAGAAQASSQLPNYLRVNFIVDVSGSMGIGAAAVDQQITAALPDNGGCAIACHYNDVYGGKDLVSAARADGAVLRIDVVKNALRDVVRQLEAKATATGQFEFAIYTFSNSLVQVLAPTTDYAAVEAAISLIDLAADAMQGGTNIDYSLQQLAGSIEPGGTGDSVKNRLAYSVLITDGVADSAREEPTGAGKFDPLFDPNFVAGSPSFMPHSFMILQGMDPASCDGLKTLNHHVIAFDVEYLIPPGFEFEPRFGFIAYTLRPKIMDNMKRCASDEKSVVRANNPAEILAAADSISSVITKANVKLTQ